VGSNPTLSAMPPARLLRWHGSPGSLTGNQSGKRPGCERSLKRNFFSRIFIYIPQRIGWSGWWQGVRCTPRMNDGIFRTRNDYAGPRIKSCDGLTQISKKLRLCKVLKKWLSFEFFGSVAEYRSVEICFLLEIDIKT
jgi:hypothetical protein